MKKGFQRLLKAIHTADKQPSVEEGQTYTFTASTQNIDMIVQTLISMGVQDEIVVEIPGKMDSLVCIQAYKESSDLYHVELLFQTNKPESLDGNTILAKDHCPKVDTLLMFRSVCTHLSATGINRDGFMDITEQVKREIQ